MAAVRILRPPMCGDSASQVPREHWPELLEERQRFCRENVPHDCRLLLFFVEDAAQSGWLGYQDRDAYVREGLGLDPDLVGWALEGLQKTKPDAAVGFDQAIVLGRQGRPKKGEEKGSNATFNSRGADYQLARLRRDAPELADQVQRGEISANKAAIKAGFRKPSLTVPLDPEGLARAVKRHFTAEEVQRLVRALVGE